ncbi:MAG: zinc ribbon domain-containing protein [Oscillospiraceae bacterium]|nr:zinc ribbon domain-containing protein [Oscillospiraceae bacterium]
MNKKLTNTKGFPLVMMIFAFLFSACAVVQEFVMHLIYEKAFAGDDNMVDYVLLNGKGFFDVYGTAVTMFVFTFLVMFTLIGGVGKKTTGTKEGVLLVITGIAFAVTPAVHSIEFLIDGKLNDTKSDGELFRAVNQLVCYGLPAVIGLFIVFSGLGILIKAGASKTTVEVFKNKAFTAPVATAVEEVKEEIPAPVMEEVAPVVEEVKETVIEEAKPVIEEVKPVVEEVAETVEETVEEAKANVCKSCGNELAEGAKFCRHCGAKV